MISKSKRIITIGATTLGLVLGAGVFFTSTKGLSVLKGKADETVNGSIAFSASVSSYHTIKAPKYSFKGTTGRGTNIYLVSDNNYNLSSSGGLVASFGGSSYASKYFSFYADSEGTEVFNFQNVQSMTITTKNTSGTGATFNVFTQQEGPAAYSGSINAGSSLVINEIAGAHYIKLVPTSSTFLDIATVSISYTCDPSGEPEPEPVTLSSLTLSGGKNHFDQNEEFSFTGTATAHYSDSTSKVVTPVIKTAPNMSTLGISNAVLSYTEDDVTVEANYRIQVGVYELTYAEYGQESGFAHGTLSPSAPEYAAPGSSVSFSITPSSGYELIDCMDYYGYVTYTINSNTISFTMPNYDLNLLIVIQEESGGGSEEEGEFTAGDYQRAGGNYGGTYTIFGFVLNSDHTGYYYRNPKSSSDSSIAKINITWSVSADGKTITVTNKIASGQSMSDFGSKRPFTGTSVDLTNTGTISGNKFTMDLYTSSGTRAETCDFTLTLA